MSCEKNERRTFLSLFKIFNCPCPLQKEDEIIYIGNRYIEINYMFNSCYYLLNEDDITYLTLENKKLHIWLNEVIINQDLLFILWLDDISYLDKYFDYFTLILDEGNSIKIIVSKWYFI